MNITDVSKIQSRLKTPRRHTKSIKNYTNNNNYEMDNKFCSYSRIKNHSKSERCHLKNKNSYKLKCKRQANRPKQNSSTLCFATNDKFEANSNATLSDDVKGTAMQIKDLAFLSNKLDE